MSWTEAEIGDLSGRVAVVTGANSGIGLETARVLAARGARVILGCRSAEKGSRAVAEIGGASQFEALDLASLDSVADFAGALLDRLDGLDLLANNAGVMMPPLSRTADGFELQLGTNHLGHFALTARLLPLLRDRPGARIVTVSSVAHRRGRIDFDDLDSERRYGRVRRYGQSKLANLLFAYELERRLRSAGAAAASLAAHPGWTATNLQAHIPFGRLFNQLAAMKPIEGARPTLRAATDRALKGGSYVGPTGAFEMWGPPGVVDSSPRSHDGAAAARLWSVSEAKTGVRFDLPPA